MPRSACWTPSPRSLQSRKIFQVFMRAKTCSVRARTCLWLLLCACFQPGSSSLVPRGVGDDQSRSAVAAVGDRHGLADGALRAGLGPGPAVVTVARQWPADHDHQSAVGVDDYLMVRRIAMVLRLLGHGVIAGRHKTRREIVRCLKRYAAGEVFHLVEQLRSAPRS